VLGLRDLIVDFSYLDFTPENAFLDVTSCGLKVPIIIDR
jgi:hypothetical protein